MKTLEEVIKQKCKFIGDAKEEYDLYRHTYYGTIDNVLFLSSMTIETKNLITLLEEMTPLLVYIFSCILYNARGVHERRTLVLELHFALSRVYLSESLVLNEYYYDAPIRNIEYNIDGIKTSGHCMAFLEPFGIKITLRRTEHEVFDYYPSDFEDEVDAITINEIKTYKTDECVICLENKTNVLFCNCGHICVCEKCIEIKRLTKCPVCKTENNILRLI